MKKLLIIVCAIMMVASLTVFAGCKTVKNNDPAPSTSTNPTESTSTVDSTGTSEDPGQSTQTPQKTPHAAPAFEVVDGAVIFKNAETVQYKFKEDGGAWQEGSSTPLDATVGQHVVTAVALADEDHLDSAEATFSYETKETSVSVAKTNAYTGTVSYEGTKLQVKDGENFVDCTTYEYAEETSKTYTFKAVGGWAEGSKTFYAIDTETEIITVPLGKTPKLP